MVISRRSWLVRAPAVAVAGLALFLTGRALHRRPSPPRPVPIGWADHARAYRGRIGQVLWFLCPPGTPMAPVWGTDVYTDHSSICGAGLHSGRVSRQAGGALRITILPGGQDHPGSVRNGLTTRSCGPHPGRFAIVGGAAPGLVAAPLRVGGWAGTATPYRGRLGEAIRLTCPPGEEPQPVWGTDVYSDHSSVCTAAVHAGRIDARYGGMVQIHPQAGLTGYLGAERHGVRSDDLGPFPGSFAFMPVVPPPTGQRWLPPVSIGQP